MGTVSTPPVEQARSIFSDLGYTVSGDGPEFRAEREWKVVHVSAITEPGETPDSGAFRCFVTYDETAETLEQELTRLQPDYEWAIISVDDDAEYDVVRAPPTLA
jgi:hypothetical protein